MLEDSWDSHFYRQKPTIVSTMGSPRIIRPGKRLQFANLKIAIYMFIYPLNTVIFDSYVSLPEGIEFDGSDNLLSQQKMPSIGFESGEKKTSSPIFTENQLDGGSSEVREQLKKYVMWLVDVRPSGMCHQSMFDSEISPGQPQKDGSTSWPGVGDPGVPIF